LEDEEYETSLQKDQETMSWVIFAEPEANNCQQYIGGYLELNLLVIFRLYNTDEPGSHYALGGNSTNQWPQVSIITCVFVVILNFLRKEKW
jgi:hypothetical protein